MFLMFAGAREGLFEEGLLELFLSFVWQVVPNMCERRRVEVGGLPGWVLQQRSTIMQQLNVA